MVESIGRCFWRELRENYGRKEGRWRKKDEIVADNRVRLKKREWTVLSYEPKR